MTENKYTHREAFCIMTYQCSVCNKIELLWNSRDGVTPFSIGCLNDYCNKKKLGPMVHINWEEDICNPNHCPKVGDRVFIDSTRQILRIYMRMRVEKFWEDKEFSMKDRYKNKEEAVKALCLEFQPGQPFVLTV